MIWSDHISLKQLHTFSTEVQARKLVSFRSVAEAQELVRSRPDNLLILGGGSNVLFRQDYPGIVALNRIMGIEVFPYSSSQVKVKAMAGVPWVQLTEFCVQNGYGGMENLSLIPGCTGASPMQNIGAYGVEIKDIFLELEAIHRITGHRTVFTGEDCGFGYRESIFKNEAKDQYIITSVSFLLTLPGHHQLQLEYGAIKEELALREITEPTIADVAAVVSAIRKSKLPDPALTGNAGSFFKNPIVSQPHFKKLLLSHPGIPGYRQPDGHHVKIPAAFLIEQAGFKGFRKGDAGCHPKQPLVLVNYGNATGSEILVLAENIIKTVHEKFEVTLDMEVNIIG